MKSGMGCEKTPPFILWLWKSDFLFTLRKKRILTTTHQKKKESWRPKINKNEVPIYYTCRFRFTDYVPFNLQFFLDLPVPAICPFFQVYRLCLSLTICIYFFLFVFIYSLFFQNYTIMMPCSSFFICISWKAKEQKTY